MPCSSINMSSLCQPQLTLPQLRFMPENTVCKTLNLVTDIGVYISSKWLLPKYLTQCSNKT